MDLKLSINYSSLAWKQMLKEISPNNSSIATFEEKLEYLYDKYTKKVTMNIEENSRESNFESNETNFEESPLNFLVQEAINQAEKEEFKQELITKKESKSHHHKRKHNKKDKKKEKRHKKTEN